MFSRTVIQMRAGMQSVCVCGGGHLQGAKVEISIAQEDSFTCGQGNLGLSELLTNEQPLTSVLSYS